MSKTIVITGASSGVGAAAARRLAQEGDTVIIVGRDPRRTNEIADGLGAERHVVDFAKLSQVRELAAELAKLPRIDVLANNAGVIMPERRITEDGHELAFQVNHLAGFLLTRELLPTLIASKASVIQTSSVAHYWGHLDLTDLQLERRWSMWRAYSNSKLANVLFTRGLHRRHSLDGLAAAAFHPGVVASSFGAAAGGATTWLYSSRLSSRFMSSNELGADTLVWLAQRTPPRDWASGEFYIKRRIRRPNPQARHNGLVDAFWEYSEHLLER